MKLMFKSIALIAALFAMLFVGLFFIQPAYAQVVPAKQSVLMADMGLVLSVAYTVPFTVDSRILVAPSDLPGHLKYTVNYSKIKHVINARTGKRKGGFQRVEIVRLIKFRKNSNGVKDKTGV